MSSRSSRRTADQVRPTPLPVALLLAAIGGILALLAFPPYDLWMLLPVSLALLSGAVMTRSWISGALAGLVWGLAFFVPLTEWAGTYAGTMPWIALGMVQALYIVPFALAARTLLVRRGPGAVSAVVVALLWVGIETLRSHWPWGGLPWGATGFALQDSPLLNLGPWIGMSGLAFVVGLIGQMLFLGGASLLGRRQERRNGLIGVWPLAGATAAILVGVLVPLPHNPTPPDRPTIAIAGIQGNVPPIDPDDLAMPPEVFWNHVEASDLAIEDAAAEGRDLDLIVWPEDSAGNDPRIDQARGDALTDVTRRAGAPVLVGTQTLTDEGRHRYNMSLLWDAEGGVTDEYAKRHPVPFGEYIPARDVFRMVTDKVDMVSIDMLPGDEVGVMPIAGHDVGVLICFEIAYENLVRDTVTEGAEVIVVQSNNALFGDSNEAIQQLAEARVLSVISGRSIVHVSTVGHSAIVTPDGRTLDFVDHWEQGVVQADVPLRTGTTPAMAAGPWPAAALCLLGIAGWAFAMSTERRVIAIRSRQRGGRR
ncbi:MAG: apolipoprotein N-acyltransferase [Brachybacterium sp.]|nr:apolipoprotein N-acyltransferase [Brachybacterium sp.]